MPSQDLYRKTLEITDLANVVRGLGTPFDYYDHSSEHRYPLIDLGLLRPPFREDIDEAQFFMHSHINVIIDGTLRKDYERLIKEPTLVDKTAVDAVVETRKRKDEIPVQGIQGYDYEGKHRLVTNDDFPILYEIIMRSDNASFIYYPKGDKGKFGLYLFRGRINPFEGSAVRRLVRDCEEHDVAIPKGKELRRFKERLSRKIYEIIAWPWVGKGTKHLAAGRLVLLLGASRFCVDVLSKSGIYSRTEVDRDEITTTHKMLQLSEIFGRRELPDEYVAGKERNYVLYSIRFRRNKHFSAESCWVDFDGDYFLNLNKPSQQGIRAGYFERIAKGVGE